MENISKSLLNAIGIIANKTAEDVSSDKTIKAIIKKCVNLNTGQYLITYNNRDLNAYTQASNTEVYSIGDEVYVLVPSGDMSERKIILSKTITEEKEATSDTICLLNNYNLLGSNVISQKTYKSPNGLYNKKLLPLSLSADKKADYYYCYLYSDTLLTNEEGTALKIENFDDIKYPILSVNEESFINYAKQAEALLLRAKFKANLNSSTVGNYGIIINMAFNDTTNPVVDEDGNVVLDSNGNTQYNEREVAYVLDNLSMTGNPMKYYDYNSQYTINSFDGANYIRINSIIAFSENFSVNESDSNIYIDDIEIFALDEITAINGDYQMQITTPKGNTIQSGESGSLQIDAKIVYNNGDISEYSNFYWGVKDSTITSTSENYNTKIGTGYRYLSNIDKTTNSITVFSSDLSAKENVYRCVGIYNDDIILKSDISLYNNNNNLDITIVSDKGTQFQLNESSPTLTCMINGKTEKYTSRYDDSAFTFVWSRVDEENGNILLNQTVSQLEAAKKQELEECGTNEDGESSEGRTAIQVLSYYSTRIAQVQNVTFPFGTTGPQIQCTLKSVTTYVTYSCSVYCSGNYVGYAEITLQNSSKIENNNYYISIVNGNQVFQYTESGVSPASERNANPIEVLDLSVNFYNPQGEQVTPKQIQWVVPTENTLIDIPTLSLSTDTATQEKRFTGSIFPLSIKESYDTTATNNQITAIVTYSDDTTEYEYRKSTDLLFTKIGDIGTNGTDTVLKINELIDSSDDCLTIIKNYNSSGMWNVYSNEKAKIHYPLTTSALGVSLYTNNTLNDGYSATWSAAGSSKNYAKNYYFNTNSGDNSCNIYYSTEPDRDSQLDIRIAEAEVRYNDQYYYSYYPIPAIEYQSNNYSYSTHPIKIKKDGTLRTVLYNSDGTNPSYDKTKGVLLDTGSWTPFIKWHVEGGTSSTDDSGNLYYDYPNLLLSTTLGDDKTGSAELSQENTSSLVIENLQITVEAYIEDAKAVNAALSSYIAEFKDTIEKIIIDENTTIVSKLEKFKSQLSSFKSGTEYSSSVYVVNTYCLYNNIYNKIKAEVDAIIDYNTQCADAKNEISTIWGYTWPSIVSDDDIHCTTQSSLAEIWQAYSSNYDNRERTDVSSIEIIYDSDFNIETEIDNFDIENVDDNIKEAAAVMYCYFDELLTATKAIYGNNSTLSENVKTVLASKYYSCEICLTRDNFIECAKNSASLAELKQGIGDLFLYAQKRFLAVPLQKQSIESEIFSTYQKMICGEDIEVLDKIYVIPNDSFNGLYTNNNVVAELYDTSDLTTPAVKVYVPIIMTLNTYELSSLNGWDGVSLEMNEDEGYVLAPQIGAGLKNSKTNTFTGIVMGTVTNPTSDGYSNDKVGLIGYAEGRQSMFLNANTGEATFGFAADDDEYNEGRIELNPGGVSKIGNWKIGNKFLYNIPKGTYNIRPDEDARDASNAYKLMVPHDKYGIILSSEQPYIHIKGEVYESERVKGIDYSDEYNSINPGDSLELRLDPGNKSLFSIIQHTAGPGDELPDNLYFGYTTGENDRFLNDYEKSENATKDGSDSSLYYYVYYLNKETKEENGEKYEYYSPYYVSNTTASFSPLPEKEEKIELLSNISFSEVINQDTAYSSESLRITLESEKELVDFENVNSGNPIFELDEEEPETFKINQLLELGSDDSEKYLSFDAVDLSVEVDNSGLMINEDTGKITIDKETFIGNFANKWNLPDDSDSDTFFNNIILTYNKLVPINCNNEVKIGVVTVGDCPRIVLSFSDGCPLDFTNFAPTINHNIYFCLYDYSSKEEKLLYQSEELSLTESFSEVVFDKRTDDTIEKKEYTLVAKLINLENESTFYSFTPTATIQVDVEEKTVQTVPKVTGYSSEEITAFFKDNDNKTFSAKINSSDDSYTYFEINFNEDKTQISVIVDKDDEAYDFCLYSVVDNATIYSIGRTCLSDSKYYWGCKSDDAANASSVYIRFYPKETFIKEITIYKDKDDEGKEQQVYRGDSPDKDSEAWFSSYIAYISKYDSFEDIELVESTRYSIKKINNPEYNTPSIIFDTSNSGEITFNLFTEPKDSSLCVNGDDVSTGIKAIPLACTYYYYDKNLEKTVKKVVFKKEYYTKISDYDQAYYIDIVVDNNIYYKYIKTLTEKSLKTLFNPTSEKKPEEIEDISFETSASELIDVLNWKEFLRVGIDENGRFFTNGAANKKTYSHLGKINALGKIPNVYGQEIRTQVSSNNNNSMIPIIKTFAIADSLNNIGTTYITAGKMEQGNISIRTSKTGYVELAAMKSSENVSGEVPKTVNSVQVSYNNGIKLNTDSSNLTLNKTYLQTSIGNESVQQELNYHTNYSGMKSPNLVFSNSLGLSSWHAKDAFSQTSVPSGCYRIKANEENIILQNNLSTVEINKDGIYLERKLDRINLTEDKLQISCNNSSLIMKTETETNDDGTNTQTDTIMLKHKGGSFINMIDESNQIKLFSGNGSSIAITEDITFFAQNANHFVNKTQFDDLVYHSRNVHIGMNAAGDVLGNGQLYLYNSNGEWTRLSEETLHEIYRRVSGKICWYTEDSDGISLTFWQDSVYYNNYTNHDAWTAPGQ